MYKQQIPACAGMTVKPVANALPLTLVFIHNKALGSVIKLGRVGLQARLLHGKDGPGDPSYNKDGPGDPSYNKDWPGDPSYNKDGPGDLSFTHKYLPFAVAWPERPQQISPGQSGKATAVERRPG